MSFLKNAEYPPLDTPGAANTVMRRVRCVRGKVSFRLVCHPAFHYGQHPHQVTQVSDRELRFTEAGELGLCLRLVASVPLEEQELTHLEGYREASPVRVGNQAYHQTQLDVYGELMNAIYLYDQRCEPVSHQLWKDITRLSAWRGPDG